MDGKPTGPDTQVTFPFELKAKRAPLAQLATVTGNNVVYQRELVKGESAAGLFEGFGSTSADYDIPRGTARYRRRNPPSWRSPDREHGLLVHRQYRIPGTLHPRRYLAG